jgi:hypothetical protein
MAPYSGGGQRARGWGYVREPAEGFFIGGSSVKDMNGVYKRVNTIPGDLLTDSRASESFQLVYRKWPGCLESIVCHSYARSKYFCIAMNNLEWQWMRTMICLAGT